LIYSMDGPTLGSVPWKRTLRGGPILTGLHR